MEIKERDELAKEIIKLFVKHHCTVNDREFVLIKVRDLFGELEVKEKEQ